MPERATLRPVPRRIHGPVDPWEALAFVEQELPDLDSDAQEALALIEIAGHSRARILEDSGAEAEELAAAIARARKALRRAAAPLPGSGWCERAERLLSDELDGALTDPGARRLAAHLANCDRCVEHDRRLFQARDRLVVTFEEMAAPPEPVALLPEKTPEPELKLVTAETPMQGTPEPADPPTPEPPPAALVPDPHRSLVAVAWAAMMGFAVLLAVLTIALTVYAIAGGSF